MAGPLMLALVLPWLNPFAMGPSPPIVQSLVTMACTAIVLMAAAEVADGVNLTRTVAAAWIVAALASCVMGLLQYFSLSVEMTPWVNSAGAGEAFANLRQRNQFASLVNIGLVALLWWPILRRPFHISSFSGWCALHPKWFQVFPLIGAALLGAGNAASSSRTGLAQLVLIAILASWWGQLKIPRVRRTLLMVGLMYAFASIVLPRMAGLGVNTSGILSRLHDGGAACSSRLTLWSNVLHLIGQKPWTGWGWGELDFAHFITLYPGSRFCEILDNAHNLPLHLAVELGLPFATLVGGAAGWLVIRAKPWQEANAVRQMSWAILALIMLHSMLEYPLWYGPFQITFALCIWLLWREPQSLPASQPTTPNSEMKSRKPQISVLMTGFALALLAFTAYAAWDYHRISQIYLSPEERSEAYRDNTLAKIRPSWLFRDQVRFAELTTTELTQENASEINTLAKEVLHFSPESRVVAKVIESAAMLGHTDEVLFFSQRFKAAYPQEYERWVKENAHIAGQ